MQFWEEVLSGAGMRIWLSLSWALLSVIKIWQVWCLVKSQGKGLWNLHCMSVWEVMFYCLRCLTLLVLRDCLRSQNRPFSHLRSLVCGVCILISVVQFCPEPWRAMHAVVFACWAGYLSSCLHGLQVVITILSIYDVVAMFVAYPGKQVANMVLIFPFSSPL